MIPFFQCDVKLKYQINKKVGCVFPMAVFTILPQSEFWPVIWNDDREDTPHIRGLRIKTHYQRISNPLSYCLLVVSKMTDNEIVGETFANTIGAHYFDLLITLCDHCWSTSGVTIDMGEISKLFKGSVVIVSKSDSKWGR